MTFFFLCLIWAPPCVTMFSFFQTFSYFHVLCLLIKKLQGNSFCYDVTVNKRTCTSQVLFLHKNNQFQVVIELNVLGIANYPTWRKSSNFMYWSQTPELLHFLTKKREEDKWYRDLTYLYLLYKLIFI